MVGVEGVLLDPYGDPVTAYGYINKDGTVFKEPNYLAANSFAEGLAAVQPAPSYAYGMGILKADGEYLLPPPIRPEVEYEENEDFSLYSQGEYDFVKAEVKRIVSEITDGDMNDLEKITVIYKYVMDHANYSMAQLIDPTPMGLRYMFEPIGILKGKLVVCNAYAKLLVLLLNEAGIENMFIHGESGSEGSKFHSPHAWNLVSIEGKYYHVDATYDDRDGPNKYFLVSDGYMKKNRRWDYTKYPEVPRGYFNDEFQPKE